MFALAGLGDLPLSVAIPVGVLAAGMTRALFDASVLRALRQTNVNGWGLLIVSLGLYTIFQNALSLTFGDYTRTVRAGTVGVGPNILGAYVTDIELITVSVCATVFILTVLFLRTTRLGRAIRGISSNPELCSILGIDSQRTLLWAVAIGSALGGVAGVLSALDTDMNPSMGFRLLMNGVVVMIIGGVGSYWGLAGGALLLGAGQHFTVYFFDSKWMDAVAFVILTGFLIWKPLGFTGRRLKKVEV